MALRPVATAVASFVAAAHNCVAVVCKACRYRVAVALLAAAVLVATVAANCGGSPPAMLASPARFGEFRCCLPEACASAEHSGVQDSGCCPTVGWDLAAVADLLSRARFERAVDFERVTLNSGFPAVAGFDLENYCADFHWPTVSLAFQAACFRNGLRLLDFYFPDFRSGFDSGWTVEPLDGLEPEFAE